MRDAVLLISRGVVTCQRRLVESTGYPSSITSCLAEIELDDEVSSSELPPMLADLEAAYPLLLIFAADFKLAGCSARVKLLTSSSIDCEAAAAD